MNNRYQHTDYCHPWSAEFSATRKRSKRFLLIAVTTALATAIGTSSSPGAESVVVESLKADGTPNTPAWTELSGKWDTSKNKSRVPASLVSTNVSICTTNVPVPAFKVSPAGLTPNTSYKVEVTFGASSTHGAASDLTVAVSTEGISTSTVPTNTPAFQGTGADSWTTLGTIIPVNNHPSLTFTYVSGTLSKTSRWYADALRFTPEPPSR